MGVFGAQRWCVSIGLKDLKSLLDSEPGLVAKLVGPTGSALQGAHILLKRFDADMDGALNKAEFSNLRKGKYVGKLRLLRVAFNLKLLCSHRIPTHW